VMAMGRYGFPASVIVLDEAAGRWVETPVK
jgi:hypothetical protein